MLFVKPLACDGHDCYACTGCENESVFAFCDCCGERIYRGDEYYEIEERQYCCNCIDDFCKQALD